MRGRQTRGRQTVSVNSGRPTVVVQKGSSNKGSSNSVSEQWSFKRGRQTVSVNSGRPTVVVQKGSSNKGSSNSVSEQWSSNSGRPKGVVKQCQ